MIIKSKIGNLNSYNAGNRTIDLLSVEWFETSKRILHKTTTGGRHVSIRFMKESQQLMQDDIIFADDSFLIAINILPCEAIIIQPETMYQMAYICYEIGNKHLPLFYQENELLIPYEAPVFRLLQVGGFSPKIENRKLLNQLKTSVSPHGVSGGSSGSLFSKILQLTTSSANE